MFYKLSKFFLYATAITPLLLIKSLFFPFIVGKALFFRTMVELALLALILHLLSHLNNREVWQKLAAKLKHPFVICITIFALMFTLTALVGVNPTQSFWSNFERGEGAFQMLHYAMFFILTFILFTDRKSLERLLLTNIVVSIPLCLYALLQLVTPIDSNSWFVIAPGDRVSGTLGNPSYLAAYLIFIFVFLLYFFIKNKDPMWRLVIGLIGAFEFFIFLKTGTRGAFLGVVAALLVLAAINLFISKNKRIKMALAGSLLLMLLLTGTFFATRQSTAWQHVPILNRLINFNSAINDIRPRLWTWGSALSGFADRPIAGWGAESFPVPFDRYYNPNHYGIESFFDRTHNIFLEYGISGGVLVLVPWLAIFFYYYARLRKRPKDLWYSILFVLPIVYLIQGFFLFDTMPIYLVFFLFLAFVGNTEAHEIHLTLESGKSLKGANIATAGIVVAAIGALLYYTALRPLQKNNMLVHALLDQGTMAGQMAAGVQPTVTPNMVIDDFHSTLAFASPVGQEETVGMYQKFILDFIESASRNQQALSDPRAKAEIAKLLDDVNAIYEEHKALYPGLKEQYLNGGINMRAGLSFGLPDYLARGKRLFYDALAQAPTRLEFMRVLIELAGIENNPAEREKWGRLANSYRPDLFKLDGTPAK